MPDNGPTCDPREIPNRIGKLFVTKMPEVEVTQIQSLWAEQPVLLCMFRRWGCGICRMSAANISAIEPLLAEKNVRLVGFGVETLGFEEFFETRFFVGELFVDEDKGAYKALELRQNSWRNLWGLLGGEIMKFFKLSQSKGFENNLKGDTNQLGGTFLIMPDGTVPYAHFQSKESFEPDLSAILQVLGVALPQEWDLYPSYETCTKKNCK